MGGNLPSINPLANAIPTSVALAVDFSSVVAQAPVYVTLLTLAITTLLPASFINIAFASNWRHLGGFAGNVAVNFRFVLDTVLLAGGTTDNRVRGQIGCVARVGRTAVTAGPHTMVVEVSKFGGVGNALTIDPVALPDLVHCALALQEQR